MRIGREDDSSQLLRLLVHDIWRHKVHLPMLYSST